MGAAASAAAAAVVGFRNTTECYEKFMQVTTCLAWPWRMNFSVVPWGLTWENLQLLSLCTYVS